MLTQTQIREEITNKIVEGLKAGVIPWRKPWRSIPDPVRTPTNFVTNRDYQGMNIPLLWLAQQQKGYPAGYWASFNQWKSVGCNVRKGEKATTIVLWKPVKSVKTKEDGEKVEKSFPILKTWNVFNVAQVEGKAAEKYQTLPAITGTGFVDVERAEFDKAVAATGADIRFGYEHAAYHRPPGDFIVMPDEARFENFPAFAETLLHECCHWTEWRTGWTGSYAEGELRAEMGACFLANALGIPNSTDLTNHTAYIQSWLKALEDDPKFIFRAAASSSKAADFILGFSRPKDEAELEELVEAA
jgi:antirestriction protein ArdC